MSEQTEYKDTSNNNLLEDVRLEDITLEEPDLQQMRKDRQDRDRQHLQAVDARLAKEVLPQGDTSLPPEVKAAVKIQAHYRGYLGRKIYINKLWQQYQKEEAMRLEKTQQQMEEGELLVENHKLEVQFDDNSTKRRNKSRQYVTNVITIQRAWRAYLRKRQQTERQKMSPQMPFGDSADVSDADSPSSSSTQPMSICTPSPGDSDKSLTDTQSHITSKTGVGQSQLAVGLLHSQHGKFKIEPDPESCVSDVSEMADPVKEHLANVQIIRKEDLEAGNTMCPPEFVVQQRIVQQPDETDEEFAKRLRKINYLSLAQEFAELKKTDSDALPFDLHKANPHDITSPGSDVSTDIDSACQSEAATPCEHTKPFPATMATESVASTSSTGLATRLESLKVSPRSEEPANDSSGYQNSYPEQSCSHSKTEEHNSNNSNSQTDLSDTNKSHDKVNGVLSENISHTKHNTDKNATKLRPASKTDRHGKSQSTIFTKPSGKNNTSSHRKSVPSDKLDDFDVYNIETALPQMDWAALEQQLKRAAEEERAKFNRRNDREAIRQKLAMGAEEEYYGGERMTKKPNLQTRLQSGMNLQLCYVNDVANEPEAQTAAAPDKQTNHVTQPVAPADNQTNHVPNQPVTSSDQPTVQTQPSSSINGKQEEKDEDFQTRQTRLQDEARMALAQVRPMAHMQLEVEKQRRKKSPIAEMVPGLSDIRQKKLSLAKISVMNFAGLQVVVNDLHSQIEALNEELVRLLVERDDLHMEQDSMLVDIEDLTRRAQEATARANQKTSGKKTSGKR